MNEWMNEMNEWINGWMNEWVNERMHELTWRIWDESIEMKKLKWRNGNECIEMTELTWMNYHEWFDMNEWKWMTVMKDLKWMNWNQWHNEWFDMYERIEMKELKRMNWNQRPEANDKKGPRTPHYSFLRVLGEIELSLQFRAHLSTLFSTSTSHAFRCLCDAELSLYSLVRILWTLSTKSAPRLTVFSDFSVTSKSRKSPLP